MDRPTFVVVGGGPNVQRSAEEKAGSSCSAQLVTCGAKSGLSEYPGGDQLGGGGQVTLTVDGKPVGTGKVETTMPFRYSVSANQDIGTDRGSPVTYEYEKPLNFEGEMEQVVVELTGGN